MKPIIPDVLESHRSSRGVVGGGGGVGWAPLHPTTTVTFICFTSLAGYSIMVVKYGHLCMVPVLE